MNKKLFTAALLAGTMALTGCSDPDPKEIAKTIAMSKTISDANRDVEILPFKKSRVGIAILYEFRTTQEPIMQCAYLHPHEAEIFTRTHMHCVEVINEEVSYE